MTPKPKKLRLYQDPKDPRTIFLKQVIIILSSTFLSIVTYFFYAHASCCPVYLEVDPKNKSHTTSFSLIGPSDDYLIYLNEKRLLLTTKESEALLRNIKINLQLVSQGKQINCNEITPAVFAWGPEVMRLVCYFKGERFRSYQLSLSLANIPKNLPDNFTLATEVCLNPITIKDGILPSSILSIVGLLSFFFLIIALLNLRFKSND